MQSTSDSYAALGCSRRCAHTTYRERPAIDSVNPSTNGPSCSAAPFHVSFVAMSVLPIRTIRSCAQTSSGVYESNDHDHLAGHSRRQGVPLEAREEEESP